MVGIQKDLEHYQLTLNKYEESVDHNLIKQDKNIDQIDSIKTVEAILKNRQDKLDEYSQAVELRKAANYLMI